MDSDLTRLIRQGDFEAFEKLYDLYHRQLFFVAKKYLKCPNLAEDAVQDLFVKIWENRSSLDPSRSVKGLLFVSLKNQLLNTIRNQKNKILSGYEINEKEHPWMNRTGDEVIYSEYQTIVKQGLNELPDRKREVFEMKVFSGLSNAEVAETLVISINTVKVHFYHGTRFIRSYLKKHADI